jgi:tetratricopeptide (TPR) repeat protein
MLEGGIMEPIEATEQALSWTEIEGLLRVETGREARQGIVRRLLSRAARNPRGDAAPAGIVWPSEAPAAPEAYDEPIRRAVEQTRRVREQRMQERRNAGRLWDLLESHPPAHRRMLVRNDRRFQTWGLYDCLIERYHVLLERELAAAAESAELALAVAQSLAPAIYGEERVRDFEAGALILLAQARRIGGDLEGAGTALEQAGAVLKLGTGDLLEKAELESARAALLRDLGRPEEAELAGRRAVRLSHRAGGPRDRTAPRSLDDTHPDLRHGGRFPIPAFRPRQH